MQYQKFTLWTEQDGISGFMGDADRDPTSKKKEAIVNMTPPTNQKQVRSFIGLVNYYPLVVFTRYTG